MVQDLFQWEVSKHHSKLFYANWCLHCSYFAVHFVHVYFYRNHSFLLGFQLEIINFSSVQFSCSVVSDSLQPHEPQHARPPCPLPTPGVHPDPCPLSRWCHPTILSSVVSFSSGPQSFQAPGSFQMSQLFTSGGQSIGVSASTSVLSMSQVSGALFLSLSLAPYMGSFTPLPYNPAGEVVNQFYKRRGRVSGWWGDPPRVTQLGGGSARVRPSSIGP